MRRLIVTLVFTLALLSTSVEPQNLGSSAGVEEILILRSIRLSRAAPTDFCAAERTGFTGLMAEDRFDFHTVATDAASGRVTNASGPRAGALHACFGPTADSMVFNFYAEGEVSGVSFVGHGLCRNSKRDFPETGFRLFACRLDLTQLPPEYVGGQLTTNTLQSPRMLGSDTDPPGYTQASIATIRLWRKR